MTMVIEPGLPAGVAPSLALIVSRPTSAALLPFPFISSVMDPFNAHDMQQPWLFRMKKQAMFGNRKKKLSVK